MPDKAWVDLAQFVLNVILAVVTLSLFVQGQRDRRRVAEDRRREQASKVSVIRRDLTTRDGPNAWTLIGSVVEVRNHSDVPVTQVSAIAYSLPQWDDYEAMAGLGSDPFSQELVSFRDDLPGPDGDHLLPGESLTYSGPYLSANYVLLRFTDGAGIAWVRTSQDGRLWRVSAPPPMRSVIFQRLARNRWLRNVLHEWPQKYATWRLRNTVSGIPWSARWIRFMWGHAPIGEPDPWMMPWGAEAREWPFDHWIGVTRRLERRKRMLPKSADKEAL